MTTAVNVIHHYLMKLNDWRLEKNYSYEKLGHLLGVSHRSVRRWCLPNHRQDKAIPNDKLKVLILNLTRGQVQPNDWFKE